MTWKDLHHAVLYADFLFMINANILLVQVQFFIISLLLKVVMISFALDFVATRDLSGFNLKQFGLSSLFSWNFTQFIEEIMQQFSWNSNLILLSFSLNLEKQRVFFKKEIAD